MATFTILVPAGSRPGHAEALETALCVKNGFRAWALILPLLFALVHRLWRPFGAIVLITIVLGTLAAKNWIPEGAVLGLDALIALYAGLAASDWIVAARERKGFIAMGVVAGANEEEALARFARHWMEEQVTPPVPASAASLAPRPSQGPVIGLFPESGGR